MSDNMSTVRDYVGTAPGEHVPAGDKRPQDDAEYKGNNICNDNVSTSGEVDARGLRQC